MARNAHIDDPDMREVGTVAYVSRFTLGQKVWIGDDQQTVATVTGVLWKAENPQIEVSWMNNGALQCVWVSPTILTPKVP